MAAGQWQTAFFPCATQNAAWCSQHLGPPTNGGGECEFLGANQDCLECGSTDAGGWPAEMNAGGLPEERKEGYFFIAGPQLG